MNIVHVNMNGDPAGVSWLLHETMSRLGHDSRHLISLNRCVHKLQQGNDIIAERNPKIAIKILKEADILHVNQALADQNHIGLTMKDYLPTKKFIFHNHGGAGLLDPGLQIKELKEFWKDFPYIVCSPLTKYIIPNCIWLPNVVPINNPLYKPIERDFDGDLKICHKIFSRQTRIYKGSDVLDEMINVWMNGQYHYPMVLKIFDELPINECLKLSSEYHICVDNLTQGFIGMSGWESLSKGQVVISRLDPIVEKHYRWLGGGTCPIINVSGMDEMCKVLRELCNDRDLLKKKCKESREWMEKYYNEERIIKMYMDVYEKVLAT